MVFIIHSSYIVVIWHTLQHVTVGLALFRGGGTIIMEPCATVPGPVLAMDITAKVWGPRNLAVWLNPGKLTGTTLNLTLLAPLLTLILTEQGIWGNVRGWIVQGKISVSRRLDGCEDFVSNW